MLNLPPLYNSASAQLYPFGYTDGYTAAAEGTDITPIPVLSREGYFANTAGAGHVVATPSALLSDVDKIRFNTAAAITILDTKIDEILNTATISNCCG